MMPRPRVTLPAQAPPACAGERQPNELDLRRIVRLLDQRVRYRYVTAMVEPMIGGYRVSSPCCSRTIDGSGGGSGSVIDIARLAYDESPPHWRLYRKDYTHNEWSLHFSAPGLALLMACLNEDPARVFWQ